MKVWYVAHEVGEYVIIDVNPVFISIRDYVDSESEDDDPDYDFSDAVFVKMDFPLHKLADKKDITNKFWKFVPSSQKDFVKQNIIKTTFS